MYIYVCTMVTLYIKDGARCIFTHIYLLTHAHGCICIIYT